VWYNGAQTMSDEHPQPDYRQTLHDSIVATAEALIASSIGVVEASRRFMELAAELDAWEDDDLAYFQEVDSLSDWFPLGVAREQWDAAALVREDHARAQFEQSVYAVAVEHCRSLIHNYTQTA
jgi:Protein of unknown function (DUF2489)